MKVDPEFRSLIPPLRPDERAALEASILAEGCRDALVTWHGVLLDGHNRMEICTAHGIAYKAREVEGVIDRLDAQIWILENQVARRNLTDDQRAMNAVTLRDKLSERAVRERSEKANAVRHDRGSLPPPSGAKEDKPTPAPPPKRDTRKEAADACGVSRKKVEKAAKVQRERPDLAARVRGGDMSLADATREAKRAEVVERLEAVEAVEAKAAQGVYDVLVIDPPWPMQKIERDCRPNQSEFDYPTMDETELGALELPVADDCHVWLWTTQRFLLMAFRLLDVWGLRYVCVFVWHKPGGFQPIGLPQYNAEFALYARRGSPVFVDTKAFPVCFDAPRGAHSEKPGEFYDVVRRVTAGRRLNMFSRRRIEGFDGWGKEAADGVQE